MKVQDFITETLKELIDGVQGAQQHATKARGAINPSGSRYLKGSSGAIQHKATTRIGQEVEFDIEVTVSEKETTKGGAGLLIGMFGLGVQGQSGAENRSVNRVKFRIPVIFPKMEYKED